MLFLGARRWILSGAAILSGLSVSAALLVHGGTDSNSQEVYAVARDLPAGALLAPGSLRLVRVAGGISLNLLYRRAAGPELAVRRTNHDLVAGQLVQRSDLEPVAESADRRLVWLGLHDIPTASPGDRLDLLVLTGAGDHLGLSPFAEGVLVHAVQGGGVVVAVPSQQAGALVYAATAAHLVAVVAEHGSGPGRETAVSSLEQAREGIRR